MVSAGNDFGDAANYSPAGCYGVITVGATGPTGDRASYSNFSADLVAISAPGGDDGVYGEAGGIMSILASGKESDIGTPIFGPLSGSSMAAPHVSGAIALMLGANPGLTIAQIRDIVLATARPFAPDSSCALSGGCGVGLLDAAAAVHLAKDALGQKWNYTDHWYLPAESGWGMQVTAQGELQFVTWYTYDANGEPRWFTMQLTRLEQDVFVGEIYATRGVPLRDINGKPATTSLETVGFGVLGYFDYYDAWVYYDVNGYQTARPITRLEFASPPTVCDYRTGSRAASVNYQDMWWNPSESGWGLNITHQGDTLFATWFTYDAAGKPLWLYLVAAKQGANTYAGRLTQTRGIPFDRIDFASALLQSADVGAGSLTFTSGTTAQFTYDVHGVPGVKTIERQVFASPVTYCEALQ